MTMTKYWKTSIPKLDELLFDGRGFRSGRGYIISGPTRSGKTILAMCFVKNMIAQGGAITYITIGTPVKILVELYKDFNIDINNYLETMDLVIIDWTTIQSCGDLKRVKKQLGQYLSEKAIANIRFGVDPCNKDEYIDMTIKIHNEKASFHGKPGIGIVDAISNQVVMLSRKGLPGKIVSEIYYSLRQKFSMEEPGTAFHLFAPLEERVSREYSVLLDDLHLNEDGTINLEYEKNEKGEIINRNMRIKSLYGAKAPSKKLYFNIDKENLIKIIDTMNQESSNKHKLKNGLGKVTKDSLDTLDSF